MSKPPDINAAPRAGKRVLVVFNTTFLYGMERATIETFDLIRPEVQATFLMTYSAHRVDLPVLREVKRRQLAHVFLSDVQGWPRLGKPKGLPHLGRLVSAFVRGNLDTLRAAREHDMLYLPGGSYLGLALLACAWFRLTGRRVVLHLHNLAQNATAMERWSFRLLTDAVHNTETGMRASTASNPLLRRKRNVVLSVRTDTRLRGSKAEEVRREFTGRRNILFAGQVSRHKGPDLLLEATALLAREYPNLAVHLFGGCDDEDQLRTEILSRGLAGMVHYWGYREDVGDLMRCAEIHVHPTPPSRFAESFGRSVVEAMAAGVPSVCFRSGVLPEIVEHGRTGWVCETESAAALAEGMGAILRDPSLRERLGRGAREKYESHHSDEIVRARWLEWFAQ